jgi:hypothetical protein
MIILYNIYIYSVCIQFLLQKLQSCIIGPLQQLSTIHQPDIRQRQLECVLQILHSNGDKLVHGWPLVLGVIGAVTNDQG